MSVGAARTADPSVFRTADGVDFALVGVGGQGIILASDLLANVGLRAGLDVKKTDSLGMSQRGGSVVSFVRWGLEVRSMMPAHGDVHVVLALETLEAARYAEWLRPGGVALISEQVIMPVSVSAGVDRYPTRQQVAAAIEIRSARGMWIPCVEIATRVGTARSANVVMLGALSMLVDLPESTWTTAITELLPKRIVDVNLRAFSAGRDAASADARSEGLEA
jgi:indolepyruvate ferredoxin oxidoreductase beta subunit